MKAVRKFTRRRIVPEDLVKEKAPSFKSTWAL